MLFRLYCSGVLFRLRSVRYLMYLVRLRSICINLQLLQVTSLQEENVAARLLIQQLKAQLMALETGFSDAMVMVEETQSNELCKVKL